MRDIRKQISYFNEYYESESDFIKILERKIDSGKSNNPDMLLGAIFGSKLNQLVLAYSLGKTKDELTELYLEFLD